MAVNCDIIIVGGGVMGVSIAWHLARRRAGKVMVLEKSFLGAGSSGKSGAIIRQHYSNRLTATMAQKSLRVFEHFEDEVGGPPVFTRTGLIVVVNEKDRAGLETNLAMQRELGIDVRVVSPQVLADIDRNARVAEEEIAAFEAEAGYVEAVQVVASFAEAAPRRGRISAWGSKYKTSSRTRARSSASKRTKGFITVGAWCWPPAPGRHSSANRWASSCPCNPVARRWRFIAGPPTLGAAPPSMPILCKTFISSRRTAK